MNEYIHCPYYHHIVSKIWYKIYIYGIHRDNTKITIKGFRFLWYQDTRTYCVYTKRGNDSNPLSFIRLPIFLCLSTYKVVLVRITLSNPDEPLNYPFVKLSAYNNKML